MNLQLSTQLKQQLTLTPALCQSLEILQMAALELEQNLQQQAEEMTLDPKVAHELAQARWRQQQQQQLSGR